MDGEDLKFVGIFVLVVLIFLSFASFSYFSDVFRGLTGHTISTESLSTGLVAYYTFDGDVRDSSENGNHGTNNNVNFVTGRFGQAAQFDGLKSYVNVSSVDSLNVKENFSISLWEKENGFPGRNRILTKGSQYMIQIYDNGYVYGYYFFNDDVQTFNRNAAIVRDNSWNLITSTLEYYNGSYTHKFYLNGVLKSSLTKSNVTLPSLKTSPLTIGRIAATPGHYFNGTIDSVRLYNRALTASEISDLYAESPSPEDPIPVVSESSTTNSSSLDDSVIDTNPDSSDQNDSLFTDQNAGNETFTNIPTNEITETPICTDESCVSTPEITQQEEESPGICSGCYAPMGISGSEDKCLPYSFRFSKEAKIVDDIPAGDSSDYSLKIDSSDKAELTLIGKQNNQVYTLYKNNYYTIYLPDSSSYSLKLKVKDIVFKDEGSYVSIEILQTSNAYCDIDGQIKEQRVKQSDGSWAKCQNNYECNSNLCSNGECVEINDAIKKSRFFKELFVKALCRLANLFSSKDYQYCVLEYS